MAREKDSPDTVWRICPCSNCKYDNTHFFNNTQPLHAFPAALVGLCPTAFRQEFRSSGILRNGGPAFRLVRSSARSPNWQPVLRAHRPFQKQSSHAGKSRPCRTRRCNHAGRGHQGPVRSLIPEPQGRVFRDRSGGGAYPTPCRFSARVGRRLRFRWPPASAQDRRQMVPHRPHILSPAAQVPRHYRPQSRQVQLCRRWLWKAGRYEKRGIDLPEFRGLPMLFLNITSHHILSAKALKPVQQFSILLP